MRWKPSPELYHPFLRTRIRDGRGVGEGASYRPWIRVRDVPSEGTSSIAKGIKTHRAHHMLSTLEATYFFLQERRGAVVDIRDAWPLLDIDKTIELCIELGVAHKYRGVYPEPFTFDFLITERVDDALVYRAAAVKTEEDAADPDTRRRLGVEHRWCQLHKVPWSLVDTSKFTPEMLSTLRALRGWFRMRFEPDPRTAQTFAGLFAGQYERNVPLCELLDRLASRMRIKRDLADDYFRYCGWIDLIKVALDRELTFDAPLILRGG